MAVALIPSCPVCGGARKRVFDAVVLGKYRVDYHHCPECGLLQTERPYWLDEAYRSPIADLDTGLVRRNRMMSHRLACFLYFVCDRNGHYLDAAGGYGLLTRLMRDLGFDFRWSDPHCPNLFARGFEAEPDKGGYQAVTAIEVAEHVHDPVGFFQTLQGTTGADYFIFSTELYAGLSPEPTAWVYYATETGQHISFYQQSTLARIAERLGMHFVSHNNLHLFSRQPVGAVRFRFLTGHVAHLLVGYVVLRMKPLTLLDQEAMRRSHGGRQ
jgi:Methyltransferase domain